MKSQIAEALGLKLNLVAIQFTDNKPEPSLQFKPGSWGCAIAMLSAASKGKTAVFDRDTYGCIGGGAGLGFGNTYVNFPGGIDHFLSVGNAQFCNCEEGKGAVRNWPALIHGEAYKKTPALAKSFADELPYYDTPTKYVVFRPLDSVLAEEQVDVVVFLATPDQLSALVVLANYGRHGGNSVMIPWGAGCHTICIIPYHEGKSENPRAVVGLTDVSARRQVDKNILSFSVPHRMFLEMECNVEGSFLNRESWEKLRERNR
jgi:uncharacterized protein (DUF169 family)